MDALQLGLHTLRHNISVIPQTPFLLKGSIKTNLDPFEEKSENELWEVLEEANLKETIANVSYLIYVVPVKVGNRHNQCRRSILSWRTATIVFGQSFAEEEPNPDTGRSHCQC